VSWTVTASVSTTWDGSSFTDTENGYVDEGYFYDFYTDASLVWAGVSAVADIWSGVSAVSDGWTSVPSVSTTWA